MAIEIENRVPGSVVQVVETTDTSAITTQSTIWAHDATIPQNTEGAEIVTVSITPKNANNTLIIEASCHVTEESNQTSQFSVALFQDSTANALTARIRSGDANETTTIAFYISHNMTAGTTSSTTFKLRCSIGAVPSGTFGANTESGTQSMGGVEASSIRVWEIAV